MAQYIFYQLFSVLFPQAIREGANAFLVAEYTLCSIFIVVFSVLVLVLARRFLSLRATQKPIFWPLFPQASLLSTKFHPCFLFIYKPSLISRRHTRICKCSGKVSERQAVLLQRCPRFAPLIIRGFSKFPPFKHQKPQTRNNKTMILTNPTKQQHKRHPRNRLA